MFQTVTGAAADAETEKRSAECLHNIKTGLSKPGECFFFCWLSWELKEEKLGAVLANS